MGYEIKKTVAHYYIVRCHCWAGLTGHKAGLVGHKGNAESLLGLSEVPYPVQTKRVSTRSWRTRGLSIVKGVMEKCELDHELTCCL